MDQLYRIFRILGTPNEDTWPGVTKLRDYKSTFPNWPSNPIQAVVSGLTLDTLGLDLLAVRSFQFSACFDMILTPVFQQKQHFSTHTLGNYSNDLHFEWYGYSLFSINSLFNTFFPHNENNNKSIYGEK